MPVQMSRDNAVATLNQFITSTQGVSQSKRIVMRGDQQLGAIKAFFSGKTERQATIDKFQESLTVGYGQYFADLASGRLDHLRSSGKALTTGMIREIILDVEHTMTAVEKNNGLITLSYLAEMGPNRDLDQAFSASKLPPSLKDGFVSAAKDFVHRTLQGVTTELVKGPKIREVMNQFTESYTSFCTAIRAGKSVPHFTDLTTRIPERHAHDMAVLLATVAGNRRTTQLGPALFLEKLDAMRAAQPDGPLQPDTIWRACFPQEPKPTNFGTPPCDIGQQLADAIVADTQKQGGGDLAVMGIMLGMRYDTAIAHAKNPGPINMDSMVSVSQLGIGVRNPTIEKGEQQVAVDLHRKGMGDDGAHSIFSLTPTPNGPSVDIDVSDTSKLAPEDLAAYKRGLPSSVSSALKENVMKMCDTDAQAMLIVYNLSQAGMGLVKTLSPFTGVRKSEHAAMNISVAKQENGDVRMTFTRPSGHDLAGGYEYDVHPDGTSTLNYFGLHQEEPVGETEQAAQPEQA